MQQDEVEAECTRIQEQNAEEGIHHAERFEHAHLRGHGADDRHYHRDDGDPVQNAPPGEAVLCHTVRGKRGEEHVHRRARNRKKHAVDEHLPYRRAVDRIAEHIRKIFKRPRHGEPEDVSAYEDFTDFQSYFSGFYKNLSFNNYTEYFLLFRLKFLVQLIILQALIQDLQRIPFLLQS